MKELEVELEQLRLLIVAVVGSEQVGKAMGVRETGGKMSGGKATGAGGLYQWFWWGDSG